ncbi:MAG TPA: DUF2142 domain-containing protein [Thermoanaerobaculia bacterium]
MRSSLVVALLFGAAFALLTPPFQVPDEIAHYYRACAIAHGGFWPPVLNDHGYTAVPIGDRELISNRDTPFVPERAFVKYPVVFSPLPFLPQALGCAIGDALHLRPLFSFYLARLLNLVCALALVYLAARIAAPWLVITPALLPMSLFLFGSFSPDALTIAMTFLATSLALAGSPWVIAAAAALALCKPAYLLVPLLVFAARRRTGWIALAVIVAGAFVSTLFIKTSWAPFRPGVDERGQISFTMHHPLLAGRTLAADLLRHGADRVEQLAGRLGLLNVPIPKFAIVTSVLLLLGVAIFAGVRVSPPQRLAALALALGSIAVVELSQYISWTPVGASEVQGVQGRYFIPIVPLFLIAISRPNERARWPAFAVPAVMAIVNAAALWAVYRA